MATADVEIMHQEPVLDEEAVARGGGAMWDQHALAAILHLDRRLDGVAAAAHIGRHIGRHMTHAAMEGELVAAAMKTRGVLGKARPEAIVERQYIVFLRLVPPQLDHVVETLRFSRREVIDFREIAVEMKQLPFVVLKRRARRMERHRL